MLLVILIEFRFHESKGGTFIKKNLPVDEYDLLIDTIKASLESVISKKERDYESANVAFEFIKIVSYFGSELDYLKKHPKSTILTLDSFDTPIVSNSADILLPPKEEPKEMMTKIGKKLKHSFADMLTGKVLINLKYLKFDSDMDKNLEIDDQILLELNGYFEDIKLGW